MTTIQNFDRIVVKFRDKNSFIDNSSLNQIISIDFLKLFLNQNFRLKLFY